MNRIDEVIAEIAAEKANAARTAAERVEINGIIFREGISHNTVHLDGGIEKLAAVLKEETSERYIAKSTYAERQQYFTVNGVEFEETHYIKADEIPEGADIIRV